MSDKAMVVSIRNYQRIKKASFRFEPGLNVIVGPSNNGKSSTLRAIATALFNLSKDSHVTVGETVSAVGIRYNGHDVVWKRDLSSASKTSYKIDGKTYTKLGKGQPKEVADALGIFEVDLDDTKERLNFQKQMAYPFLLDRTPSQVFKFMAQSAEEDNLMSIIDQMKTDQNSISATIKANEAAMDSIKVALLREKKAFEAVKGKAKICQFIINLDAVIKKFVDLSNRLEKVEGLNDTREGAEKELAEAGKRLPVLESALSSAAPVYQQIDEMERSIRDAVNSLSSMRSSEEVKEKYEQKLDILLNNLPSSEFISDMDLMYALYMRGMEFHTKASGDLAVVKECDESLSKIEAKRFNVSSLMAQAVKIEADLMELEGLTAVAECHQTVAFSCEEEVEGCQRQLAVIEENLKEFEVCPYCGSSL